MVIERVERIQIGKKGQAKKVLVARMKMKSDSFSSSIFGLSIMSRTQGIVAILYSYGK